MDCSNIFNTDHQHIHKPTSGYMDETQNTRD